MIRKNSKTRGKSGFADAQKQSSLQQCKIWESAGSQNLHLMNDRPNQQYMQQQNDQIKIIAILYTVFQSTIITELGTCRLTFGSRHLTNDTFKNRQGVQWRTRNYLLQPCAHFLQYLIHAYKTHFDNSKCDDKETILPVVMSMKMKI